MSEIKYLNDTGVQSVINETKNRLNTKQNIIQKTTLPTASATEEGNIYQYTGATTGIYTNGYFYKCINNGGTYSWEAISVQSGGGGGSSVIDIRSTDPVNPSAGQMWVLVSSS